MPNLASTDWMIVLVYLFSLLAIGVSMRARIKTSKDFFQAGRSLPTWVCTLAFVAAGLGSQEVIAMGAAGAKYGFSVALWFSLGAIPALVFAGLVMIPVYYGSGARSLPEYLGLRFDKKTRLLNASLFLVATAAGAGISLYLVAHLLQTLHIFDVLFYAYGLRLSGVFTFCVLFSAAMVLIYVLFAGLAGAMVNQVLQFLLLVAGFVPIVWIGLKNIGGWSGLQASVAAATPYQWSGLTHFGALSLAAIGFGLGLVFGVARWCTDFRVLQTAMAARNIESARRVPLLAAVARVFVPFLFILSGAIAIGLPTPQSTTLVRNENGAIFHEITIVPPETAQGHGLVPARLNVATGSPILGPSGHPLLNYDKATPTMLLRLLPNGLLGVGMAALLASLMSGLAASLTAFTTVFTCDLYQLSIRKSAEDSHYLAVSRWAVLAATLLSIGVAYALAAFGNGDAVFSEIFDALLMVFCFVSAPQLATFLVGMFTKRATGHGAFAGLAAGTVAAILFHGLTLSADAIPGLHGGWIAVLHHFPSFTAQCFYAAAVAFAVNLIVALVVSRFTSARPEAELKNLVRV